MGVVYKAPQKLTMKFLVLLAAVGYASAASSNAVTCEECQAGAAALVDRLLSEASLTEQGEILKALVCPQTADPASCQAAVDMWFGDMATCIYTPRDWTCEECTDIISRTADYMADAKTIAMG